MKLSRFGEKFSAESGIVELMDDLATALHENPNMVFMGGGNPGRVPEVEAVFRRRLEAVLSNNDQIYKLLGLYQSPQGDRAFRSQVANLLKTEFGWNLTETNIAVSNGSQSAFFVLFNLFAGEMTNGDKHTIHLPLAPEYIGYNDTGLSDGFFTATQPKISLLDDDLFKYNVDFDSLKVTEQTAAICVSRPTNPSGNVLTDAEIEKLDQIARNNNIPFIIDSAYGLPFPHILFCDAKPYWNENTIVVLSLSKLGLPGARTGIIVASEKVIRAYTNANTIVSLACGNLGTVIAREMFKTGEILDLSKSITPFYQRKAMRAVELFRENLQGVPFRIHKPEGAIFLWLWFEALPISSQQLYERLKEQGVLVLSGHNFFPGLSDSEHWPHMQQCLRVSYVQDDAMIKKGIEIIAREVKKVYQL